MRARRHSCFSASPSHFNGSMRQTSGFQDIHPCLSFVGGHRSCVPSWRMYAGYLCGLLTIERAWSRDHATSSVTAVLPPPGLNSFDNWTSPSVNSNDRWKRLCLFSWAMAPCVWTLMALTRNLLTYLLTYLRDFCRTRRRAGPLAIPTCAFSFFKKIVK